MRAASMCIVFGLAAPIVASPTTAAQPATVGCWQPLESQKVWDLAVVYGNDVKNRFMTWNTWVVNVDAIFLGFNYTVPYMATLPTAAIAASISWSATSTDAATTSMLLKVPVDSAAVTSFDSMPTTTRTSGTSLPPSSTSSTMPTTTSNSVSDQRPESAPSSTQSLTASAPSTSSTITSTSTSASTSTFASSCKPTSDLTSDVTSSSTSASALTSSLVPSPTSGPNSASTSSATPSPRPSAGKVYTVCDSCYLSKPNAPNFYCNCKGKRIQGDLNKYLWNDHGVLRVSSDGNFSPTCKSFLIQNYSEDDIFSFSAQCWTGGGNSSSLAETGPIGLGRILEVDTSAERFRLP